MKLTEKVIEIIKSNAPLQGKIVEATGKNWQTILRWAEQNHEFLTTAAVIAVLKKETGLTEKQILTERETVEK